MAHPLRRLDGYVQRGWAVLEKFLSPGETDGLSSACDERRWPDIPADLVAWIMDPRWAQVVVPILGDDVRFFRERMITKAPRSEFEVPWHQDSGYADVAGEFVSCIVALENMTPANGCLMMASGTHREGNVEHVAAGGHRRIAEPVETDGELVELEKGSAVVFSSLTHHRSGENQTDGSRRAWMLQFCRADAVDLSGRPLPGCPIVAAAGEWLARPRWT